jgi:hypothetical protein
MVAHLVVSQSIHHVVYGKVMDGLFVWSSHFLNDSLVERFIVKPKQVFLDYPVLKT